METREYPRSCQPRTGDRGTCLVPVGQPLGCSIDCQEPAHLQSEADWEYIGRTGAVLQYRYRRLGGYRYATARDNS